MLLKAYLVLYNAYCLCVWSLALYLSVTAVSLDSVWSASGNYLMMGQLVMTFEIFHAVSSEKSKSLLF